MSAAEVEHQKTVLGTNARVTRARASVFGARWGLRAAACRWRPLRGRLETFDNRRPWGMKGCLSSTSSIQ